MPIKQYGDRLTVDDISSPFESFVITEEHKQGLVDKYNSALFGDSSTTSTGATATFGGATGDKGIRDIDPSKYAPGTFSFNTNLNLPTYKSKGNFNAPAFSSPDIEGQLGDAPKFTLPEQYKVGGYEAPVFKAPQYDERKVQALTQQQAAPAVRGLRSAIMRLQNQQGENQNVNRMTMRDALAGYGQGLQSALSGASATARSLYNEEYGRKADAAKTNFEAQSDAAKTSYMTQADASKTNYLANVDAAKKNFEAQYDKYKMKWSELSDAAKMNYTSKYNEALKNWEAKQEEGKLNYQNLVDAKKLAYTAGLDVAKTNFGTQADWKKTQYGIENQKAMTEYNAALEKYKADLQSKTTTQNKAPGLAYGGSYSSSSNNYIPSMFTPGTYDYAGDQATRDWYNFQNKKPATLSNQRAESF
jgi:hypothetical protein